MVRLPRGSQLIVEFGISNYGLANPGVSPYPTSVGLQVYGMGIENTPIAESTSKVQYFADYLLKSCLKSLDGSWSVPFADPLAAGLGYAPGAMLFRPGSLNGAPVAVATASQILDQTLAESLFGQNVASYSSAYIVLQNAGADVEVGLGPGYTLRSAIVEPGIRGQGAVQTSGMTRRVSIGSVPEPATWVLLALGVAALAASRWTSHLREPNKHRNFANH